MPPTSEAEGRLRGPSAPPPLSLGRHALFLDLDGTLFDIAPTPADVRFDEGVSELLTQLARRMDGALAIVTGRSIRDADRILGGCVRWISGVHGREWLTEKGELVVAAADELAPVREQARRWALALPHRVVIEDKSCGVAFHYRHAPEAETVVRAGVETLARERGLLAQHGKMVSELLPIGPAKGEAVARLMRAAPFAGRIPVAVGDDDTDEDAFAAAAAFAGFAVSVGRRWTSAKFVLPTVADVRAWLSAAIVEPGS